MKSTNHNLLMLFFVILYLARGFGDAQTTLVVQDGVSVSRALSGHVEIGLMNVPAKGITVDLCSSDWRSVLASTKTDDNGYFSLSKASGRLFYIRLSSPGVNSYQLRVRVKKHAAHDLKIHLSIAN